MKSKQFLVFLFVLLIGCDLGDVDKILIVDDYYLVADDDIEQSCIAVKESKYSYGIIISETVFAVGVDEFFIIAKQHPCDQWHSPNKKITNYYIIPIKNKISENKYSNVLGPFPKEDFIKKREELGIDKKLDFTIIVKEME
jgi:hypothetical protein